MTAILTVRSGDDLAYEPGSYRDRDGRVFYSTNGQVYRALSRQAVESWDAVSQTKFFPAAMSAGDIVATQQISLAELSSRSEFQQSDLPHSSTECTSSQWSGVLKHEPIPFISYPYEWTFSMLRDAAVLHLELLLAALQEDFTLKDGTAYNIQWKGVKPVFVDIPSFEKLIPGTPWAGYRQFCQTFLYPLMLQAYKQVPFHPWLRGHLDGIQPDECRNLMSYRDMLRPGVLTHVCMHAWLSSNRAVDTIDSSAALKSAGFSKDLILANTRGLLKLVKRLQWATGRSTWSHYADATSYTDGDQQQKQDFVRRVTQLQRWNRVWDLGCNTGTFSRIAAENATQVIAMDADHLAVERLYQSLKAEPVQGAGSILPIVNNLVDPSVNLGWRSAERKGLPERGRPDLCLCLALIHHLVLGHGVPVRELLKWFADLRTDLIIEFVTKDDPMVRKLLRGRRDNYADYEPVVFEKSLGELFSIVKSEPLKSGTRILYYARRRSST